ncbi:MAG: hypothetical protein H8E48_08840 [Chloroflexi bacterium]|nr:hypothetical protein [Chloroflexota bacterium]
MDNPVVVILVCWMALWSLLAFVAVKLKGYDIWAGIAIIIIGIWLFGAGWSIRWVLWVWEA